MPSTGRVSGLVKTEGGNFMIRTWPSAVPIQSNLPCSTAEERRAIDTGSLKIARFVATSTTHLVRETLIMGGEVRSDRASQEGRRSTGAIKTLVL